MSALANDTRLEKLDPALHDYAIFLRKQRDAIYDNELAKHPTGAQLYIANAKLNVLDRADSAFHKLLYAKYPSFRSPGIPAPILPVKNEEYPSHYDQSGLYIPVRVVDK
jgi:hypothetical protein